MYSIRQLLIAVLFAGILNPLLAQQNSGNASYVDEQGVLRWSADNSEIHGFGVNYSTPFAHAYRMATRLGVSHEQAIVDDIYHFARLDFDLYRVHMWDTEISDTLGNLLQNEHLRLFDFGIHEMKNRGMKFVITPVAYWGSGWPEPNPDNPGFAAKYTKEGSLVHPEAIKAQQNYLAQFLNHVNPYTGIAYKDDPDVIAFEVSNEPHHQGTVQEVIEYINGMVASMRSTGTTKPIFYNMSHSIHLYRAYMEADVQGGTFQWYPTGLGATRQLEGNYLPNVSDYFIPFDDDEDFGTKAKLVYEFDAADVGGNYMYPAMARSFRTAGIQVATHFDYDAMFLAPYNTNYGTHYMSLPYAPQKALSLKISSAVFHEVPRYSDFGAFPQSNNFGNFSISYENDLVEYNSPERFFYSNSTTSAPRDLDKLSEIAGYGNSPVVKYDGKGAYFLDMLHEGIWRLEVMPDAHWLGDPYARVSPQRRVAAVNYTPREMTINIPALGNNFSITAINAGNKFSGEIINGGFDIMPGVYILQAANNNIGVNPDRTFKNIRLNEFVAPEADLDVTMIKNMSSPEQIAGQSAVIRFEVISPGRPTEVMVQLYGEYGNGQIRAEYKGADIYEAELPLEPTVHGILNYFIMLHLQDGWKTFPAGNMGKPFDWDFYDRTPYTMRFIPSGEPVSLWCAHHDHSETIRPWIREITPRPSFQQGKGMLYYDLDSVPESQDGAGTTTIHSFKFNFTDKVNGRRSELDKKEFLVVSGKSLNQHVVTLEVSLIDKAGNVFMYPVTLNDTDETFRISLNDFTEGRFAILPRPYPEFKPWYANIRNHSPFDAQHLETLQVTLPSQQALQGVRFYLEEIWVE